jgi:hypothetical protein
MLLNIQTDVNHKKTSQKLTMRAVSIASTFFSMTALKAMKPCHPVENNT